jgi:D-aspartate ligase
MPSALPPVFVMNLYYSGIGIARSLYGRGVDVFGLSSENDAPGMASGFFNGIYEVPNGRDEPEALYRRLVELRAKHAEAPILFPTRDFDVLFLHQYGPRLRSLYRLPQDEGYAYLMDKLKLADLASSLDIPVPLTIACSSEKELQEQVGRLRFPVVVKPRYAYLWRRKGTWEAVGARKAFLVSSAAELQIEYRRIADLTPEILIQEYIAGADSDIVVCCCYMSRNEGLLGYFTGKKLRQNPPLFGTGCAVEASDVPEIVPLATRILESCGYFGLAEAEFKHDKSSNTFYLIEINPRHWDQHELGTLVGVNLSWLAYQDMIGRRAAIQTPVYKSPTGCKWIAETEALMLILHNAYRQFRSGSRTALVRTVLAEIHFLLKGRKMFAIFNSRDPLPGLLLALRTTRQLFKMMMHSFLSNRTGRYATVK